MTTEDLSIVIVSDAWFPQVNGVVRTLDTCRQGLIARGHSVTMVTPDQFKTIPCPTYPEIRLALTLPGRVGRLIEAARPKNRPMAIHIATEGPLGQMARSHCLKHGHPFTTAYHTRFPEYIRPRFGIPLAWSYAVLRKFHRPSSSVMVATQTIEDALAENGFANIRRWTRGVDTALFRPRPKDWLDLPRPIQVYVGRVAIEKNIEAFLRLKTPGTKMVVGDGPQMAELKRKYPDVHFAGVKTGEDLAAHYAAADLFVFPSRTDTFGLVLLEAMASGLPVAAYPVPGPLDVVNGSGAGVLDEDLGRAVEAALKIPPQIARSYAETFSWDASLDQFLGNLHVFA
ncbi:MAG: glycosyltransferase family 4 protein [Rhodospirillales bacterium]